MSAAVAPARPVAVRWVRWIAVAALVVGALLAAEAGLEALSTAGVLSAYSLLIIRYVGINIIMAASLNLVNGVAGQFSIGHAGFMAVGAYTSAMITKTFAPSLQGVPGALPALFVVSLAMGGLLAAGAGWLVGTPSLRLRGDYLAIVTLGFGEIIRVIILNVDALGGARGLPGIQPIASVFWIWLFVVVTVVALHRIAKSDYGRALLAIREDEVAAAAMGVNTTAKKVGAFAVAAFFAGVAGGLFAHTLAYLNTNSFTFVKSFDYVVMVILGGMGSLSGAIVSATLLTVLLEFLRPTTLARGLDFIGLGGAGEWISAHDFRISLYALLLIVMMIVRPHGLFGTRELWERLPWRRLRRGSASGAA